MKSKLLILFLFVASFYACQKNEPSIQSETIEPKVTSVKFFAASAGSNVSLGCDVTVEVPDDGSVISLYLTGEGSSQKFWTVDNPKSGKHRMYDHVVGDYPRGSYYQFVFEKSDKTKVRSESYKVQ